MNNVTMGFSLISVPPLDLAAHMASAVPAEPYPGIPIDPTSVVATSHDETPEPRFERFRLAYPLGTVVMAFYAGGAMLGEVQATRLPAVVEVVEASRVSVGIPEADRP